MHTYILLIHRTFIYNRIYVIWSHFQSGFNRFKLREFAGGNGGPETLDITKDCTHR